MKRWLIAFIILFPLAILANDDEPGEVTLANGTSITLQAHIPTRVACGNSNPSARACVILSNAPQCKNYNYPYNNLIVFFDSKEEVILDCDKKETLHQTLREHRLSGICQ